MVANQIMSTTPWSSAVDNERRLPENIRVAGNLLEFAGRDRELEAFTPAVLGARDSFGGLVLVSGEAGIGKSRLAEEVARVGRDSGLLPFWGRAWETGGAPAFSPWIQILRSLRRNTLISPICERYRERLGLLLPGGAASRAVDPNRPDRSRFELFEAVTEFICDAAAAQPLLLVLEDLHVADQSSLELLNFMLLQLRSSAALIVGTLREVEAQASDNADLLGRLAQDAQTVPLGRLSRQSVDGLLANAIGEERAGALSDDVYQTTEGHPLYVVELCRLLVTKAPVDEADPRSVLAASSSLGRALKARLDSLPAGHVETLEKASVIGREFALPILSRFCGHSESELQGVVDDLVAGAFLVEVATNTYAFSHVLIREGLHRRIPSEHRDRLHLELATCLEHPTRIAPWSLIAHHRLAAGAAGRSAGIDAVLVAAREAQERLAFFDAIALLRRGLDAVGPEDKTRRFELLLALGEASLRSGDIPSGQASCVQAASIARELAPEYLARAALVFGELLVFAHIDLELISLLEEALAKLDETPSPIRARVMARLAAARQPALNPQEPIALVTEAVDMARALGDDDALEFCLGAAGSTMMDLVDARVRLPIDEEYAALAEASEDRSGMLRAYMRLIVDCAAIADIATAETYTRKAERMVSRLGDHPGLRWRMEALRAMWCLWRGEFADAETAIESARELGAEGGDPNSTATYIWQRARLLRHAGRYEELVQHLPTLLTMYPASSQADAAIMAAACTVAAGDKDEAKRFLARHSLIEAALRFGDHTMYEPLAELAFAAGDRAIAEVVGARLDPLADCMGNGGVIGCSIDSPVSRSIGLCAWTLGDLDTAVASFEKAVESLRNTAGHVVLASVLAEYARVLLERAKASDVERAHSALAESEQLAESLSMVALLEEVRAVRASIGQKTGPSESGATSSTDEAATATSFSMVQEGDYWTVRNQGHEFRLRNTKGMPMLARLLAEPGREFHALDLAQGGQAADTQDLGDSGEVLDETAVAQYKTHLMQLREEREQAVEWNDSGRVEKLEAEIEFLTNQLSSALGLGGRVRRSGGAAERARVNVQRRLRDSIRRIAKHDSRLGAYLDKSVKTGTFCCYRE